MPEHALPKTCTTSPSRGCVSSRRGCTTLPGRGITLPGFASGLGGISIFTAKRVREGEARPTQCLHFLALTRVRQKSAQSYGAIVIIIFIIQVAPLTTNSTLNRS